VTGLHVIAMLKGLAADYGVPYFAGAATVGALWVLWWVFQTPKAEQMHGRYDVDGWHPPYSGH
jgi:hypothetical protein